MVKVLPEIHYQAAWAQSVPQQLYTASCGTDFVVLALGQHNTNQGPDFLAGAIRLLGHTLHGAIEMHWRSSDWYKHGHASDPHYQQVILHVVFEHDTTPGQHSGYYPPYTLVWQPKVHVGPSPTRSLARTAPPASIEALAYQRMQHKAKQCQHLLTQYKADMAGGIGHWLLSQGAHPLHKPHLDRLAGYIPWRTLQAQKQPLAAILLGMAGLLDQASDPYSQQLAQQFIPFQLRHGLFVQTYPWAYHRMRPASFIDTYLAHWAALFRYLKIKKQSLLTMGASPSQLIDQFQLSAGSYWVNHYRLGVPSAPHQPWPGDTAIIRQLVNAWMPLQLALQPQPRTVAWVLDTLAALPPEHNTLTQAAPYQNSSALHSQAILALSKKQVGQ